MKAILIRVAITLFIRWLKKNKPNSFLSNILAAGTRDQLIGVCKCKTTEDDINEIVTDIEDETVSNLFSDLIEK